MCRLSRTGKGSAVSEYKVTLYFSDIRSGLTEGEFDTLLYKNTKHAPFGWCIEEFEEVEPEENGCE